MYLQLNVSLELSRCVRLTMTCNLPFDLIDKGKISAIRVQLTGPIPYAKLAISETSQS